jgi:hypothetical protein
MLLIGNTVEHLGDIAGTKHFVHGDEVHRSLVQAEVRHKDVVSHALVTQELAHPAWFTSLAFTTINLGMHDVHILS